MPDEAAPTPDDGLRLKASPQLLITLAEQIGGLPGAGLLMIYNQIVELNREKERAEAERDDARNTVRVLIEGLNQAEREAERLREFTRWLVGLDETLDDERRTVTLTKIIANARDALDGGDSR